MQTSKIRKRCLKGLVQAYWGDWIAVIGLAAVAFVVNALIDTNQGRISFPGDLSYAYPAGNETVPFPYFLAGSAVAYLGTLATIYALFRFYRVAYFDMLFDFHHFALGFAHTVAVTMLWTVSIKKYVGYIRPSGIALSQDEEDESEARQSYVSGHTSFAFAFAVYLTFYLIGKFGLLSEDGLILKRGAKVAPGSTLGIDKRFSGTVGALVICLVIPMALATFVGASRIVDYWHHPADVNGGALVGTFAAFVGYSSVFAPLGDARSYLPRSLAFECRQLLQSQGSESTT